MRSSAQRLDATIVALPPLFNWVTSSGQTPDHLNAKLQSLSDAGLCACMCLPLVADDHGGSDRTGGVGWNQLTGFGVRVAG